jgi:uncharacterized protein (TIGR00369 family)
VATMLEIGHEMIRGERELFGVARLIGLQFRELIPGRALFTLEVDERHYNPLGTLHGGVYVDLADAAMGWAFAATLGETESFTTIELKINFLRAVRQGLVTAEANVIKSGSTIGYVDCDVKDDQGRLVAKSSSTCMKLKK